MDSVPPAFRLAIERWSSRIERHYRDFFPPRTPRVCGDDVVVLATERGMQHLLTRLESAAKKPAKPRKFVCPVAIESQMEHKKEQFFLRSLFRVERPEEEFLPFEVEQPRDAQAEILASQAMPRRYQRPQLLNHRNLDDVIWWRRFVREVFFEDDWTRRFGKELRESISVAVWRLDADRPKTNADSSGD